MVIVDANLLLYAHDEGALKHDAAKSWFERQLSGADTIGLTWLTITAFLRISTDHRIFKFPLHIDQASSVLDDWLGSPRIDIIHPATRHWRILKDLLKAGQAKGPLVMDAHLAAFAVEYDAVIATSDRDFSRFPDVRTIYPMM